jgi:hypothetical protein
VQLLEHARGALVREGAGAMDDVGVQGVRWRRHWPSRRACRRRARGASGSIRRLSAATLVTSCGNGAWYTCWALFLTGPVGLSPGQVGIAITVAGAIGLLASAPLGALADRVGVGTVLVALSLVQACGFVAYLAVHGFWALPPVACATVAARAARRAGAALGASCVLFALSDDRGGSVALLLLFGAAAVHVVGELLFVAASWRLSVDLMPADAPGEYQGAFAIGQAGAQMIAPAVMVVLVVGWGAAGWLVLASVFALAAVPATPTARWALRTRPAG